MAEPDLSGLVADLYANTLLELQGALRRGTTILLSRVGDGAGALIAEYRPPVLGVDAVLYPGRDQLRMCLLREAVTRLVDGPPAQVLADLGPRGDAARLDVAGAYGSNAETVVNMLERPLPANRRMPLSITEVLAGLPETVPLVVFDAHLLDRDARWDLRETDQPLLLITRPDHLPALTGDDAPFYGHANTVELQAPGVREWMSALERVGQKISHTDLEWLLDRTRGRVGTTIRALKLRAAGRSPRTPWRVAVRDSRPRAHDTLLLAREVHAYAPALLLAIAQDMKPYSAVRG